MGQLILFLVLDRIEVERQSLGNCRKGGLRPVTPSIRGDPYLT